MRNAVLNFISHGIIWLIYMYYENMRNEIEKSFSGKPERFYFDTIRANTRLSSIHKYIALSRKDKLVRI